MTNEKESMKADFTERINKQKELMKTSIQSMN